MFHVKGIRHITKKGEIYGKPKGIAFPDARVIMVSDRVPKKYKSVIINHEIGHILDPKFKSNKTFDVVLRELKAHKYALKKEPFKTTEYTLKRAVRPEGIKNAYRLYLSKKGKDTKTQVHYRNPKDAKLGTNLLK